MTRRCGVLLHPTSLPGPHGSGDLGEHARHFVDWLVSARQSLWQVLPLGGVGDGNSPYMSDSAFAGNPALIDLQDLQHRGWLEAADLQPATPFESRRVAYDVVTPWRLQRLELASQRCFAALRTDPQLAAQFADFRRREQQWLEDYALFKALCEQYPGEAWHAWPRPLAAREPRALSDARQALAARIAHWCFVQWCFDRQWQQLRGYAHSRGIRIVGDVPIFVSAHSVDVWVAPQLFQLDAAGGLEAVAGVPPDYFSPTGQRWGNPLYRWEEHQRRGYDWWIERLRRTLAMVDEVRIDHFRGFAAYWRVPAEAIDATRGEWVAAPGEALFAALRAALGPLPVIAEDLGIITPEVTALRRSLGFPGMTILQFAWDGDSANPYLPHNHARDSVVYTGTHDNDTSHGWWRGLDARARRQFRDYFELQPMPAPGQADGGADLDEDTAARALMRAACASVADTAVLPMQDILGPRVGRRMNTPGMASGCWEWRFDWTDVGPEPAAQLAEWCRRYGRGSVADATR
ncbi:MAG: 4-alpha-glucanotransferase [Gammaproteobacteria bacterium]|nr:4-alpha-glucanotransferase [Gammaproteobacteria bacterium]